MFNVNRDNMGEEAWFDAVKINPLRIFRQRQMDKIGFKSDERFGDALLLNEKDHFNTLDPFPC